MLTAAGVDFKVVPSPAEEIHDVNMPLHQLCEKNAELKASVVARDYPYAVVIGADTLVYIDETPLGKPKSEEEAKEMLARLSGRTHHVCTGVCLAQGEKIDVFHCVTEVVFRELTSEIIEGYMSKVNVMDKAGSYAVQEHGDEIVAEVNGDYDSVVGMPMKALLSALSRVK